MNLKKNTIYKIFLLTFFNSLIIGEGIWVKYGWELFDHVTDARSAAIGNANTGYNFNSISSSLTNPAFSSVIIKDVTITHQSRLGGIVNSDMVGFQLGTNSRIINMNLLYEGVSQIPDTRNMLLDWGLDGQFGTNDLGEGNGVLDEGERLDKEQLRYFDQHQIGVYGAIMSKIMGLPIGIGYKILSYYLDEHFALGVGLDLGYIKKFKNTTLGIVIRNSPASGLIWDNGTIEGTMPSLSIGIHRPFTIGIKNTLFVINPMFDIEASLSNSNLDSQIRYGTFSIDASYGFEGVYKDNIMLRGGRNSVNNLTGGIGIAWDGLKIDYAFLSTSYNTGLGIHHLISLSLSIEMVISKMLDITKS